MKTVFLIAGFAFGGAERVLCHLANTFARDGHEVTVVTLTEKARTYPLDESVQVVNGIGWHNYADGIFRLRKILVNLHPDVVISFLVQVNIAACMALIGTRIPLIVSERNDPRQMPPEASRKLLRKLFYPRANGFVFQTEEARDYFSPSIVARGTVIPNPLFLEEDSPAVAGRPHRMLAAGRLVPQKNQELLLGAFADAVEDNSEWTLDIYGDGEDEERNRLSELTESLGIAHRVFFHPASRQIHREMGEHSVFILSSDFEGMPNALMEAMGMGMACISTDCPCGGPRFLITPGENGILVPVKDRKAMAKAMKILMEQEDTRVAMGEKALTIRERLSADAVSQQWKDYMDKVIR